MPQRAPVVWILVADGRHAHIYTRITEQKRIPMSRHGRHRHYNQFRTPDLVPVPGMAFEAESPDIYDIGPDQLGRVFESAVPGRHMTEPRLDIREEIRIHFARMLAARLNEALMQGLFDRLVLVAPPKMLGELRESLYAGVKKRIAAELPKDLTHYNNHVLLQHLQHWGLEQA